MPRRPRVLADGVPYHAGRRPPRGARVFAAPDEAFSLQVDAVEGEPRRRLGMSGAILNLATMPDLSRPAQTPPPPSSTESQPSPTLNQASQGATIAQGEDKFKKG